MGIKLLEGIFTENLKDCEKKTNGYRHITTFGMVEIKSEKPLFRFCKISVSFICFFLFLILIFSLMLLRI